jgi:aminoglycoside phosphotransferase (APT) family kinase protein
VSHADEVGLDSLSPQEEDGLRQLLNLVLGASVRVVQVQVAQRSNDYVVLLVRLSRSPARVVVKFAGPQTPRPAAFDRTAAIIGFVRRQTVVPTVEVLAADVSYREVPWRYLITTYAPGHTWLDVMRRLTSDEATVLHRQLGGAVAALHGLGFPAFGEIDDDGTVAVGLSYREALMARAQRLVANPHHVDQFLAVLQERAEDFADVREAGLCHEDLNPGNIVLQRRAGQWDVSAIIDFDIAWAGNPESDLARLELWRGMTGAGFWEGYMAGGSIATTSPNRRLVLQLLWCLEYASQSPRHAVDTQKVCAGLGIPPIPFT